MIYYGNAFMGFDGSSRRVGRLSQCSDNGVDTRPEEERRDEKTTGRRGEFGGCEGVPADEGCGWRLSAYEEG